MHWVVPPRYVSIKYLKHKYHHKLFACLEQKNGSLYALKFIARNRGRENWIPTVWMMMKTKPLWNIKVFYKIDMDGIEVYLETFGGTINSYFVSFTAGGSGIHRPIAVPNRHMGQKAPGAEYRSKVILSFLFCRKCDLSFNWWMTRHSLIKMFLLQSDFLHILITGGRYCWQNTSGSACNE